MVWATVEEARSGGDHGSHIRAIEDKEATQAAYRLGGIHWDQVNG